MNQIPRSNSAVDPARGIVPILAGGGTRLPAHVGVLQALDDLQIEFDHIVGVSGGSIVAGLRAAGWSPADMKQLALEVDFRQFKQFNLYQLIFRGGLSSGDHFESWMNDQVGGRCFDELPLDLHVVATDVRNGAPVVFDRRHSPKLPVARAIRYSMGIPLLFAYKEYEKHLMVDGCILSEDALRCDWAGNGTPCVSFRLRAEDRVGRHDGRRWVPLPDYVQLLIRAFMTTISREYVQESFWSTTVVIDTGRISPLEFRLSQAEKLGLFRAGYETTSAVLPTKMARWSCPSAGSRPEPVLGLPAETMIECE